jgi:hypothetical protein
MNSSKIANFIAVLILGGIVFLVIHVRSRRNDVRLLFASAMPGLLSSAENSKEDSSRDLNSLFYRNSIENKDSSSSSKSLDTEAKDQIVKVVVIDKKNKCLDDVFFRLPRRLRASAPEEVTDLITTERIEEKVGSYSHYGSDFTVPAIQHYCEIKIVDVKAKRILEIYTISGRKPPSSTQNSGRFYRTVKDKKVVRHIKSFFRDNR